ncbi:MAG: CD1871A family CXXC motif-containing protein [Eubacteriales bacterium]
MNWFRKNIIGLTCLVLGISFLAIGIVKGEDQSVFQKAIMVCLECIGIG